MALNLQRAPERGALQGNVETARLRTCLVKETDHFMRHELLDTLLGTVQGGIARGERENIDGRRGR